MTDKTLHIAYCGLDCSECPLYKATLSGYRHSMEKIAKKWSEIYGADISAENINCRGCRSRVDIQFSHCYECSIRLCAMKRNIDSCAECIDYECVDLNEFFELVPDAKRNIETIRNVKLKSISERPSD